MIYSSKFCGRRVPTSFEFCFIVGLSIENSCQVFRKKGCILSQTTSI